VDVPEDVRLDDVQAAVLGLLHQPRPHLRSINNHGDASVRQLGGH
jgi:hypothetical protein